MKCIVLAGTLWLCACGATTSSGGGSSDVGGTDALSDVQGAQTGDIQADVKDGQGTDVTVDTVDVQDTSDAACPSDPGGACCCAGDVAANLTCSAGAWTCPAGYGKYFGDQCNGSKCGGPCSLPCPMDAGETDTSKDDTGPGPDADSSPAATLCTSTGGTVYSGQCCSSANDFPDECGIGGCTCAPQYLKDIHRCNCGAGKCFKTGTGCN